MQNTSLAAGRGFTLVELLIVVIILAILAAIVVPQFTSSTGDAKESAVDSTLSNLRTVIDLYYQQHGSYPGSTTGVPTAACAGTSGLGAINTNTAMMQQLSRYTDLAGGACSVSDATNHKFGPYLKKIDIPPDPIKNVAAIEVVTAGDLNMAATAGDPGGWKYDVKTGKLILNMAAYQAR